MDGFWVLYFFYEFSDYLLYQKIVRGEWLLVVLGTLESSGTSTKKHIQGQFIENGKTSRTIGIIAYLV